MREHPEHDKLAKISDKSQAIGEFLEWLSGRGVFLAHYPLDDGQIMPSHQDKTKLLAEFYEIDLDKIEQEKRAMLEEIRALNEKNA